MSCTRITREYENMKIIQLSEKIAYGLGDMASSFIFAVVTSFLMYYYTDVFGLSAAVVGTLLFAARMIDAITDPLMGIIADRTKTRWGRFRPYILFGSLPMAILAILTFTTPDLSANSKIIYAYATYTALMICYTIVNIPYSSLPTLMSSNSEERTELASWRMFFAFLSGLIVSGITLPLVNYFGAGNEQKGFQMVMTMFACLSLVLFLVTFFFTKERVKPLKSNSSLKEDFSVVIRNKAWWILLIVGMLIFSVITLPFAVGMYFFRYNVGNVDLATGFFVSGNVGMIAGALLTGTVLNKRFCKVKTLMVTQFVFALLVVNFYWIDITNLALVYGLMGLVMAAMGAGVPLLWSMTADTADYSEWKSHKRVIGLTTSSVTFSHKFGMGLSGMITGLILTYFGYAAGESQTPDALYGIILMMSILPAVGGVLNGLILSQFPINKAICQDMNIELERRRKALESI